MVCLGQWPHQVLLEVQASLRLWGGLHHLYQTIQRGYQSLGLQPVMALGPTPRAAEWTAEWMACSANTATTHLTDQPSSSVHQARADLHPLPLAFIPEAQPHLETLSRMGLSRLGDLLRLPRTGLSQRFGTELLKAIDAALGRRPDLRQPIQAPAHFSQTLELPITSVHQLSQPLLLQACEKLLIHACAWLRARQAGSRHFEFFFQTARQSQARLALPISLAQPTTDPLQVLTCLRIQLEQMVFQSEIESVELCLQQPESWGPASADFFSGPQQQTEQLQTLLNRLSQRLGADQIVLPQLQDSHTPEQACRWLHWSSPPHKTRPAVYQAPETRPLWLLDPPQALARQGPRPCLGPPLTLKAGPERIETQWWSRPIQRDYFIAQTQDHRLVWIFRNPDHQWFLHGYFG